VTDAVFLPYTRHTIDDGDVEAVAAALRSGWLTTGSAVDAFERQLAQYVGTSHAIACSSGTAALHLALLALGVGPGDRVVVPTVTFLATANAVRLCGAEVVFADVSPHTGLLTVEAADAALSMHEGARAVVPVHLNGQCVHMPALAALATDRGVTVIEDAAHALGSRYGDAAVSVGACRHSAMAAFSFHPAKLVTMGEGGAVTTADPALAERLRILRNHGMVREAGRFVDAAEAFDADGLPNPWYYEMQMVAPNYRASDLNCALGNSQLAKAQAFITARREAVAQYDRLLADRLPQVRRLERMPGQSPAWHLYPVFIDFAQYGTTRAHVMRRLAADGIGTQVHYRPLHRQSYYRQRYGRLELPGADAYYSSVLSLPLFAGLTEADVHRVVDRLAHALGAS
jgi:UDP-4-amino-4,6-dideoxy-N-acetyl-beta-L-altrosamine transaminase